MRYLSALLFLLFSVLAFSAEKKYSISLKDWPADMSARIVKLAPEIKRRDLDLENLNGILKKLDENFHFNSLKLVRTASGNDLLLVGEISPEVKKITFEGLSNLTDAEALSLMGLNINNILDEDNLKAGSAKLSQYFREQGYRFAQVGYAIQSESTIVKNIVFSINKKEKTKLIDIQLDNLGDEAIQKDIGKYLKRNFRLATLNQENLNKIANKLRTQLSTNGYYLTQVPSPQITFSADELTARVVFKLSATQRYHVEVQSKHWDHTSIEDDILKLNSFSSKDQNITSELVERLKTHFVAKGYPHVNVPTYEVRKNNRIFLTLILDEGPYTKIADFRVTGQYSREESFYKEKFYDLASPSVQEDIFIKEDIEQAAKNLLIFIQNDGFVNAKLARVFISTVRENPSQGVVVIQIEEGQQVRLGKIKFNGVSETNLPLVLQTANIAAGQSLSLIQLETALYNIKSFYEKAGYIEYKLLNEGTDLVNYSDNNSKIDLKFDIREGPRVEVQSIVTEGNTRTKDKLILTELDFKIGDVLNPEKIEESISRLQRTGHFNSVEITTLEKDTAIPQRTAVIKVVERDPGVGVLGIGLTDENRGTLHGYAGLAYRNFGGRGIGASFRSELNYNFADIKYLEQKHTFGFVYPYLFGTRTRFRTSATRAKTIADVRIKKVSEANSAVFSLEQDFTSHITGIFSYSVSTFKDHGITPDDEIKYGYTGESLVIGSIGPTLDIDYRDNLFNPTKGSFSRLSLEYAAEGLGNNNVDDFYRVIGQTTHYFPIRTSGVVFAQSLHGGYLKDLETQREGIPFDKRGFLLGGRTTIRGFESSEFFPTTADIGASYRLMTNSSYQLVKSELRFPLSAKYDLAGALFYDGGQVQIEGVNLSYNWRDAVGFGIRYNTPVGPLSLEYAQKLNKKAGESDGAFHLSVGVF